MTLITGKQLNQIATTISPARAETMAELLNTLGAKYGIKDLDTFHEFLANVVQESGEFAHKEENMNYRAATLLKVWPSRFKDLASTVGFAGVPKALANKVYGDRMGNVKGTDDGWNFRGGGFIGLTGREVYQKYAAYINETPEIAANLIRTTDKYALDSALWFFCILKDLEAKAVADDFIGIVKSINGGLIGLHVRKIYYERCKSILK